MANSIFDNGMQCLFCAAEVRRTEHGGGYLCSSEACRAYYLNSGTAELESMPHWYQPDGSVEFVQDGNHGNLWIWCRAHESFERDSSFQERPCAARIQEMTAMLSG